MKYVNPKNEGNYVCIVPGTPHSPNPVQQRPYVNHRVNGASLDKHGNFSLRNRNLHYCRAVNVHL